MNVADIITEFDAFYLNSGQGKKDLAKLIYFRSEIDELFTPVNTNDTVIRRGSSTMTRLLQPFQKGWSPTGAVTFKAHEIPLFKMKMDFEDYPDELEETWLGFLAAGGLDRKTWPFVKWLIQEHLMPQLIEDYELNEVYGGVYAAPGTPGTAGAVGTAMNGIKKTINDMVTAGDITTTATGAPSTTPSTWVGQVEDFVEAIDTRYRGKKMTLAMNQTLFTRFKKGMRTKYNVNYEQAGSLVNVIDFPNITVKGFEGLGSSEKIFCTPRENAICGMKKVKNMSKFQVENVDRMVKIYNDWFKGVGFIFGELVFTNDRDLA